MALVLRTRRSGDSCGCFCQFRIAVPCLSHHTLMSIFLEVDFFFLFYAITIAFFLSSALDGVPRGSLSQRQ